MRRFISVFAVAGLVVAILACPGCRKTQTVAPTLDEGVMPPVEDVELILPEPPAIGEFKEPENKDVFQDVHFDFDRSDVRPVDRPLLEGVATYLKGNASMFLLIEGHCDERGTNEYNIALGERRALSTRAFLAGLGVEDRRMVTLSLGEEEPLDPAHNEEAWAKNRRAHFKVASKGSEAAK